MFYTYVHYTPQGRLFYIGKGSNERRAHNFNNRNSYWNNIVAKYGKPNIQILADWNTEQEAFEHEKVLISCFRSMRYELANLTDGGEGTVGIKLSDEHKKKISFALKGKPCKIPSEETRRKLSISHMGHKGWNTGMKGIIKQSPESIAKRVAKMLGHTHNVKYKYTGINKSTLEKINCIGNPEIIKAGFDPSRVRDCANGKRKSHKGYLWTKTLLKDKKC